MEWQVKTKVNQLIYENEIETAYSNVILSWDMYSPQKSGMPPKCRCCVLGLPDTVVFHYENLRCDEKLQSIQVLCKKYLVLHLRKETRKQYGGGCSISSDAFFRIIDIVTGKLLMEKTDVDWHVSVFGSSYGDQDFIFVLRSNRDNSCDCEIYNSSFEHIKTGTLSHLKQKCISGNCVAFNETHGIQVYDFVNRIVLFEKQGCTFIRWHNQMLIHRINNGSFVVQEITEQG